MTYYLSAYCGNLKRVARNFTGVLKCLRNSSCPCWSIAHHSLQQQLHTFTVTTQPFTDSFLINHNNLKTTVASVSQSFHCYQQPQSWIIKHTNTREYYKNTHKNIQANKTQYMLLICSKYGRKEFLNQLVLTDNTWFAV